MLQLLPNAAMIAIVGTIMAADVFSSAYISWPKIGAWAAVWLVILGIVTSSSGRRG
jgi:hypothetical protein